MKTRIKLLILSLVLLFCTGASMQGERPGVVGSFGIASEESNSRNAYTQFTITGQSWGAPLGRHGIIPGDITLYNDSCGSEFTVYGSDSANGDAAGTPTITIGTAAEIEDCDLTFFSQTDETVTIQTTSGADFQCGVGAALLAESTISFTDNGAMWSMTYMHGKWQCKGSIGTITYND